MEDAETGRGGLMLSPPDIHLGMGRQASLLDSAAVNHLSKSGTSLRLHTLVPVSETIVCFIFTVTVTCLSNTTCYSFKLTLLQKTYLFYVKINTVIRFAERLKVIIKS